MTMLSVPVLLGLGWGVAGLLWWDHRRHVIAPRQLPWTMASFVLLGLAMILAIVAVPATSSEQLLRFMILAEAVYGLVYLSRRRRPTG